MPIVRVIRLLYDLLGNFKKSSTWVILTTQGNFAGKGAFQNVRRERGGQICQICKFSDSSFQRNEPRHYWTYFLFIFESEGQFSNKKKADESNRRPTLS